MKTTHHCCLGPCHGVAFDSGGLGSTRVLRLFALHRFSCSLVILWTAFFFSLTPDLSFSSHNRPVSQIRSSLFLIHRTIRPMPCEPPHFSPGPLLWGAPVSSPPAFFSCCTCSSSQKAFFLSWRWSCGVTPVLSTTDVSFGTRLVGDSVCLF